jgi:hypothetical protein
MSRRPAQLQDASPQPTQPVPRGDHLARVITPRGLQAPPPAHASRSWLDVAVAVARAAVVVAVMVTAVVLRDGVGARRRRRRWRWRWCGRRRDRHGSRVMVVMVMVAGHGRAWRRRRARGSRCRRRSGRFLRSAAGMRGGRAAACGESQREGGSGSQHGESERHVRVLASVLPACDHGISAMTRSAAGSGSAAASVAAIRS